MMNNDTRCVEGRMMRHDPKHDDPYLETDMGGCEGCEECDQEHAIDAMPEAEFRAAIDNTPSWAKLWESATCP